jgi:flagellar motor switch protein FliN/FliY
MPSQTSQENARDFSQSFAESLSETLSQSLGEPWSLSVLDSPDLNGRRGQPVHFCVTAEGAIHGDFFVEFYEPYVSELADQIANGPGASQERPQKDAIEKLISSAMLRLEGVLTEACGAVTLKVTPVEDLAFGGMFVVALSASSRELPDMPILLYFDGTLLSSLSDEGESGSIYDSETGQVDLANLNLVMDVELNVTLRFGQCQMPLREVLELASGSVIELDRMVEDPVELLLDGKVVARGEAVIVDGNYGLRVTEIPQPMTNHLVRA